MECEGNIVFIGNNYSDKLNPDFKTYYYNNIVEYKKASNNFTDTVVVFEKKDNTNDYLSICLEGFKFKKPCVTIFILPDNEEITTIKTLVELGADFIIKQSEVENINTLVELGYRRLIYKKNILKYTSFLENKMKEEVEILKESKEQLNQQFKSTIAAITNALGLKSEYTSNHSKRVARLVVKVGEKLGISGNDLQLLEYAGLLHDIGKIGVPDNILNKPGKLTPEEYEEVKKHSIYSLFILKDVPGFEKVKEAALHEHERFDGKGYPSGLKGEEIPLFSRIIAVCDTWDSLIFDRVYRKATTKELALEEIQRNSGTQFDSKIVEVFTELVNSGEI